MKLTSKRAPRRRYRGEAGTGRQRGPGSVRGVSLRTLLLERVWSQSYGVGLDANVAGLLVLDKPGPSAALNASQSGVHLVLELGQAAEALVNGLGQSTRRRLTTAGVLGGQVLPEESVVQVTTAVEVDGGLKVDLSRDVVLGLGLLQLLDGSVVAVDIGLVVVLVVQLHDLARDRGLQSTVVIWVNTSVPSFRPRRGGRCSSRTSST